MTDLLFYVFCGAALVALVADIALEHSRRCRCGALKKPRELMCEACSRW